MSTLDKVIVIQGPNGKPTIISFMQKAMKPNQTEDEFIQEELQKIYKIEPQLEAMPHFEKSKSEVRDFIKSDPLGHQARLKINSDGSLSLDKSIDSPLEALNKRKDTIKQKLLTGQQLTSGEADFLVNGR